MPAGLSAQRDIRRPPDSRTERPDSAAAGISSSDGAVLVPSEGDLLRHHEHQRERGAVGMMVHAGAAVASPYDRSLVAVAELSPLIGQNCTVLRTDVARFGSPARTSRDRRLIRSALFDMTDTMLQGIADVRSEDRGDGMLTVVWPGIPTWKIMDRLLGRLLPDLLEYNLTHHDSARFQLRAAIDVGPVISDRKGFVGDTLIGISRLVDALPFKKALEESGAGLGVIATNFVYETVLKDNPDLAGYSPVRVKVKEYKNSAWMRVFDTEISPHCEPDPALAG